MKWFKEFLGFRDGSASNHQSISIDGPDNLSTQPAQNRQRERDRMSSESGVEIDYSSCKRHGASYRGLPKSFVQPKCTGRTALCREVLNDTLVSFPSWSEDSTFVSSRKTQYEEYIYRCEDERFELDIVIESNLLTIRVLEAVKRKIEKMSFEEKNRFRLDDTLGGTSCVIHQRAIRRIYGDKAPEIIEGLKKNPVIAVPLVLRRLKAKDEEWREAQKQFNKIWREQNEKYYLKSLDHQGISFKQNDIKYLRSKSLIKEIEDLQRESQDEDLNASTAGGGDMVSTTEMSNSSGMPLITLVYQDREVLDEACNLIIHHVKRQPSIHKEEKQKIKQLMRQFIPDLYFAPRGELSDDEIDENDEHMDDDANSERRYDSNNDINRRLYDNRNHGRNELSSSPKSSSRFNRESPKLSCDESPLKDPELGEPIRPDQRKYLSDIESPQKDETMHVSFASHDDAKMESLSVIIDNSNNKECENSPATNHQNTQSLQHSHPQKDLSSMKSPQQSLQNKDPEDSYHLFYTDDKWYCFFRLHHILCQRLRSIYERSKVLIAEEEMERKDRKESTAIALRLKPRNDIEVEDYFPVFVDMIKQLLDGNLESNQYEDMLRDMFGIYAYVAFTMDKVVQNIVRQLQHMVSDESSQQCTELYLEESKNNATGGPCATAQTRAANEANYLKRAEQVLEDENCYKVTIYKNESKVTIGLLDTESPDGSDIEDPEEKWSNFMTNEFSKDNKSRTGKQWFLMRNVRRYLAREEKLRNLKSNNSEKPKDNTANTTSTTAINDEKTSDEKTCAFRPENYRNLLVVNNGDHVFFYRHHRPTNVKQTNMTDIKRRKFQAWATKWYNNIVSSNQVTPKRK
jgi:paired amphipathic helix protein Sin3a